MALIAAAMMALGCGDEGGDGGSGRAAATGGWRPSGLLSPAHRTWWV